MANSSSRLEVLAQLTPRSLYVIEREVSASRAQRVMRRKRRNLSAAFWEKLLGAILPLALLVALVATLWLPWAR